VPNKIGSNVRDLICEFLVTRLKSITLAGGYNTQPFVTEFYDDAIASEAAFVVWLQTGPETPGSGNTASRQVELEMIVSGMVRAGEKNLRQEKNKLLQDVRSCIEGARASLRAKIGTGTETAFGTCEDDEGLLLEDGRGWFQQPFTISYKQGVTW